MPPIFRLSSFAFSLSLLILLTLTALAVPPAIPATQPSEKLHSPVAPGAKPIKLADGFAFTEGSVCDPDGNVLFVDQPNNRIMKWTFDGEDPAPDNPHGALSTFLQPSGYSNGMCLDTNDQLITCADEKNQLWSIDPATKNITVLLKDFNGKLLNGPNDVWIIPVGPNKGGMFITDPLYSRSWWGELRPRNDRTPQQPGRYVYYLTPDRKTLTPVITDYRQPNGIIGTPDGKTLYVSDIDGGHTYSYAINPDASLSDKKLFCNTGSDGMTIDDAGFVYTTHGRGLMIWDKTGQKVEQFNLQTANVCIAGKNKDLLFICAFRSVYTLKLTTHSVGPQ
jgi:gluconolactonase